MKKEQNNIKTSKSKQINKKKLIIYIILLALAFYIGYVIFLLVKQPTSIFTVENGEVSEEETNIGYIIRDETVIKGENYKNGMEQIKAEGEKVANGDNVYRYYSKNEESLKEKIAELDIQIQEIMASETGTSNSDIKSIELQIDEKLEEISKITDVSKLVEYKKEINSLITKKAEIAGDLSPKGSYLKQLRTQRANYETQLNSGAEYIKAPKSGIVSYKVDGLEEKLTTKDFSVLNKEFLEGLNLKTGKIIATNEECGKIIDNFSCYIATISSSESAKQAEVGNSVKIRLSNNVIIDATITYLSKENDEEMLIVLQFDKQIKELANYRKISFDLIWWEYKGLKVPNESIAEEDGLKYVVRNRAGYLDKILVKVVKQNEKYSIVESYDTEELKELNISTSTKKISLYDEILLYPDLAKIK